MKSFLSIPSHDVDPDGGMLPEDWRWDTLGKITKNFDGNRIPIKSDDRKKRQGSYPYYGASGIIDTIDDFIFDGDFLLIAEDGANLLSRSTPIAFQAHGKFWVNNHAHVVQTKEEVDQHFLEFYLNSINVQQYVTGSAQPKITQVNLNTIPIPHPPLVEQQRIVARVEALLSHVNAARDLIERVPLVMKRFQQVVLAAACSGRLTEGWREENLRFETNRCDLEQILVDRRKKWLINQKTKKYREPLTLENEDLPDLPLLWSRSSIDQIASTEPQSIQSGPFGSNLLHSEFQKEGILAIGIDNVLEGMFSLGKQHRISPQKYEELKKYSARPLDVLVTVMATIGRCCVVPKDIENAIITKHVYRITVDKEIIDPFFLLFTLMGDPTVGDYIQSQIRGQTRPGINGEILKKAPIPIPPLAEQHEIVRRVGMLFERADAIDREVAAAGWRCERLTQAVLAKAFSGRL